MSDKTDERMRTDDDGLTLESIFRQIVESIPVPVAVTTPSGEVESLNRPTLEYFGKTFDELKGWKSSDVVHPDDLERTIAAQIEAHEKGHAYNVESRHRRADGTYRWFNVLGLPLRDEHGSILRWFILQIDIEDRKRAEEAVKESKRNLGQIINAIPAMAWGARPDGSGEFFNQHYLDYVGLSLEALSDWGWTAVVHPEDITRLTTDWNRILASKAPGESEARIRRYDGEYRWFMFRANPLLDESGKVVKWYGTNWDIEDRKRGEILLRESERHFKTIFDEAGAGISMCDLAVGEPIRNNRALQKMLGCTEDELSRFETYDRLTHEDDREKDSATFRDLVAGNRDSLRIEKHFVLKDGRSIWANVIFTLLRDDDGHPRYIIAIHEDITERKLALEKLQANQELLDLAQKSAGAMAFDWYIQEEINSWSPEQEALFGLAPGAFDGTYKTWKSMMYAPDWPVVVAALQHAHKTGTVEAEYRVVWPDGSLHWLSTNGRMFFDDAGQPLRMVGFTSDVTRRKLIEEDLKRSEAFLAESQQLARMGSFSLKVETDEITWSEHLYRIYEVEPGTPITFDLIKSRVHPEDISLYEQMIDHARKGDDYFEWQYRLLMPDGSMKHMHAVAHASRDKNDRLEYVAAVQDITPRRRAQEALDKARADLAHAARVMSFGALTASIAHEVNQPLSGIITNASTCVRMLDADPPNIQGALETARRTIRDGKRASDVITRLRAMFRKKDFTKEPVDLNEAAEEVIALSRTELQKSNVVLRMELTEGLPPVEGDRVQLQQVILNLLMNAADAMSAVDDRPRELTILTSRDVDDRVRLSVRDIGTGFSPDQADKLFDAFYTTKESGMGIGLSVSRSIIEGHQGRLWVEPNHARGAVFSFSIPTNGTSAGAEDNQTARNA